MFACDQWLITHRVCVVYRAYGIYVCSCVNVPDENTLSASLLIEPVGMELRRPHLSWATQCISLENILVLKFKAYI